MAELTIYYSISNGGDGSAYPYWFESMELAEWDQEQMEEGWGEPCTESFTVEGDNLKFMETLNTKESYFFENYYDWYDGGDDEKMVDFIERFFPNKRLPVGWTQEVEDDRGDYCYYMLRCGDVSFSKFAVSGKDVAGEFNMKKLI